MQNEGRLGTVTGAALDRDQLDALRLEVLEGDGRSVESVRAAHFDAVHVFGHSASFPVESVRGRSAGSRGRAFHHEVIGRVLDDFRGHSAGRRAIH